MKIISSTIKPKIRKVSTILMVLVSLTGMFTILFFLLFRDIKFEKLSGPFSIMIWFLFMGSLAYFKKREVVYIDKNNFIIRDKKILITDVISIEKVFLLADYRIRYYDGDEIKSFLLEVDQATNTPPDFIKKLQALVEKNHR